jgi:ABC-type hemin transport system ATPase subunit
LVNITEQIEQQVLLLQDDSALLDLETVRARLEAIRQFAAQGLHFIEERDRERPKPNGSATVE